MTKLALIAVALTICASPTRDASFGPAAKATNEFGVDLYRRIADGGRTFASRLIRSAARWAMKLDGSEGETRREMARVLHLDPHADSNASFALLQKSLAEIEPETARIAEQAKQIGGPSGPITIAVANRLFVEDGYEFQPQFFARVKDHFGAAPEIFDFRKDASGATKRINDWAMNTAAKQPQPPRWRWSGPPRRGRRPSRRNRSKSKWTVHLSMRSNTSQAARVCLSVV
jgi:serine protease inhibitor